MLSQEEKHQLELYCKNNPDLNLLIQHLEESHRMELSRISHEIRNPVTLINSFLQLTVSHHPEAALFDTWKPILENIEYLKQLLNELSDYNNSAVLHKEEFSLTTFLTELVQEYQAACMSVKITFHKMTAIPPGYFDKTKLRSAVLNLIRNASEALGNQADGEIKVSLAFDGDNYQICIENNGPEIPAEYLPNLFEPFITHKKDGTGLGLAIVRNIVQAHEGSVNVISSSERTCFTLRIPLSYKP